MKKLLASLFLLTCIPAMAADLPAKAKQKDILAPIPLTGCGWYFGINTMGSAGAVSGSPVPGASIVQGEVGGTIGYTCTMAANGTAWFAEANFDVTNANGTNTAGLKLGGPVDLYQRVGVSSPLQNFILLILPGLNNLSTPSLPVLPPGVTAGPGSPYVAAGIHEQDVSAQFVNINTGAAYSSNRIWAVSPELDVGILYRLSNSVVADVWAGYQMQSQGACLGPSNAVALASGGIGCAGLGNMWRAGLKFQY